MATAFDNLDDSRKVSYNNYFDSNKTLSEVIEYQRQMDRGTDLSGNTSLHEDQNMGHYDSTSSTQTTSPGTSGHVNNVNDTVRIRTTNVNNERRESININVTEAENQINELHNNISSVVKILDDEANNLAMKIREVKLRNDDITDSTEIKFQAVQRYITELNKSLQEMNNTDISLIDPQDMSNKFKTIIDNLTAMMNRCDFTNMVQTQISQALNDNLDSSQIDSVKESINNLNSALELVVKNGEQALSADNLQDLVRFLGKVSTAVDQVNASATSFTETTRDMSEGIATASDEAARQAHDAEEIARNSADIIQALRTQVEGSVGTMGRASDIVKTFFKEVGGATTSEIFNSVDEIYQMFQNRNFSNNDLIDSDILTGISKSSQEIVGLINALGNGFSDTSNLDAYMTLMSNMKSYSEEVNNNQSNMTRMFTKILQDYGNNDKVVEIISNMQQDVENIKNVSETTINNFRENLSKVVEQANQANALKIQNASTKGTKEYDDTNLEISSMFSKSSISSMSSSQGQLADTIRAMTASEISQSSIMLPGIYNAVPGNFLKDRDQFKSSVQNAQRTNIQASNVMADFSKQFDTLRKNGSTKEAQELIKSLSISVQANAKAHLDGLKNINLHRGQYKVLNDNDKKTLDTFLSSSDSAADALRDAIAAIEAIDPQSKELDKLKKINSELSSTSENIKDIKDDAFDVSKVASGIITKLKSAPGLLASGMSLVGLGAFAKVLTAPGSIISGAFEAERRSGELRYKLARSDYAMGSSIDVSTNNYFVNDMAKEYFAASQGDIGWDRIASYAINLRQNVGGHYGSDPSNAKADMDKITKYTFGVAQLYGLSDSTVSNFMKTYFKDLRHTAEESSYALVRMARAANAAGIPVEQYISNVTNMTSSLRQYGVEAEKVEQFMKEMTVNRGMRSEDAMGLLKDTASAGQRMGQNWGESGLFGILAGQGDLWSNIASGMMPVDSNGNPKPGYYKMMTERLFTSAGMMGMMGGGPGTDLGTMLLMNDLKKKGYSDTSVSMLGDAYRNNDMTIFEKLLEDAEKEKEDSEQGLRDAMRDAKNKITASGNQVSETTKAQTHIAILEKNLGEIIQNDLQGPLSSLRKGFGELLDGFVSAVETVVQKLKEFANSPTAQALGQFMSNLSPGQMALAGAGTLAGGYGAYKAVQATGQLVKHSIMGGSTSNMNMLARTSRGAMGKWAAPVAVTSLVGAGFLAKDTQAFKDVSNTISGIFGALTGTFTSGEMKAQLVGKNEAKEIEKTAKNKKIENETERNLNQSNPENESNDNLEQSEVDKSTTEEPGVFDHIKSYISDDQSVVNNITDKMDNSEYSSIDQLYQLAQMDPTSVQQANAEFEKEWKKRHPDENDSDKKPGDNANPVSSVEAMSGMGFAAFGGAMSVYNANKQINQNNTKIANLNAVRERMYGRNEDISKTQQKINKINDRIAKQNEYKSRNPNDRRVDRRLTKLNNDLRTYENNLKQLKSPIDARIDRRINPLEEVNKSLGGKAGFAKSFVKGAGPMAFLTSGITSGMSEYEDYKKNPDRFTGGERFARWGISTLTEGGGALAGMAAGAAIGSIIPGAGTVVGGAIGLGLGLAGGMAGSYGGKLLGDQMKRMFGISDEDGKKFGEQYEESSRFAAGKYTDSTDSLINSHNETSKAAKESLEQHGVKMNDLTQIQQSKMDLIFNELKNLGFSDKLAAAMAGNIIGDEHNETDKIVFNDDELRMQAINDAIEGTKNNRQLTEKERASNLMGLTISKALYGSGGEDAARKAIITEVLSLATQEGRKKYNFTSDVTTQAHKDEFFDKFGKTFRRDVEGNEVSMEQLQSLYKDMHDFAKDPHFKNDEQRNYLLSLVRSGENLSNMVQRIKAKEKWSEDDNILKQWKDSHHGLSPSDMLHFFDKYVSDWRYDNTDFANATGEFHASTTAKPYYKTKQDREIQEKVDNGQSIEDATKEALTGETENIIEEKFNNQSKGGSAILNDIGSIPITSGASYNRNGRPHKGIDLGVSAGSNTYAAGDGVVTVAGYGDNANPNGYGNWIEIKHDSGYTTRYAHLSDKQMVQVGQKVKAGELIGLTGNTGRSSGDHEHFEVRDPNGNPIMDTNILHEYAKFGIASDGSIGDGSARFSNTPSSSKPTTQNDTNSNDPESAWKQAQDAIKQQQKQLFRFNEDPSLLRDKFATGRLIFDGTTTALRDRNTFITPLGVQERLALSSGAKESSLYGFNMHGNFQYRDGQWILSDTSGMTRLKQREEAIKKQAGDRWGKTITFNKKALEHSDKAITDTENFLKENYNYYEKPMEEKMAEEINDKNDLDEKNSVNIAINNVGGVNKRDVFQIACKICEGLINRKETANTNRYWNGKKDADVRAAMNASD